MQQDSSLIWPIFYLFLKKLRKFEPQLRQRYKKGDDKLKIKVRRHDNLTIINGSPKLSENATLARNSSPNLVQQLKNKNKTKNSTSVSLNGLVIPYSHAAF